MNKSAFIDWYKWTSIENSYFVFGFEGIVTFNCRNNKKKVFTRLSSKSKSGKA